MVEKIPIPDTGVVHVWSLDLRLPPPVTALMADYLSHDERQRAARFRFERHRKRYVAGRGFLRMLLAACLDTSPESLVFSCTNAGKPYLKDSPLQFNLSHSDDLALVAISPGARVGVDVEQLRSLPDAGDLVRRFFSPREAQAFHQLPPAEQQVAFLNLWTRKEALLKATGEGIAHSLASVEVAFRPGEPAGLLALPESFGSISEWSVLDLPVPAGFIGAVAVRSPAIQVQFSQATPQISGSQISDFSFQLSAFSFHPTEAIVA
jgi:4'-phosphopantetheinyl transferase